VLTTIFIKIKASKIIKNEKKTNNWLKMSGGVIIVDSVKKNK